MNLTSFEFDTPVAPAGLSNGRMGRRFGIPLKLRWKVFRRRRLVESGTGTVIDISSSGVLFESDGQMPVDGSVELAISWPALLLDTLPMQLIVSGRVVRVSGRQVAIDIRQHEFRTARSATATKTF